MQTSFYASGFLYSLRTHQILLLKSPDLLWTTIGGEVSEGEETQIAFQRIVNELLDLNLKTKDIYPIYDYSLDDQDKNNYVFYAEVKKPQEFNCLEEGTFSWVGFDEISKFVFTPRTKQDVIVGERVINAKSREDEAKREIVIS